MISTFTVTIPVETETDPSSVLDEAIALIPDFESVIDARIDEDEVCVDSTNNTVTYSVETETDPSSILDEAVAIAEDLANVVDGRVDEDEVCVSEA